MYLNNQFLLSMPSANNIGIFAQSLTYICEHHKDGAVGLIINQAMDVTLGELLQRLSIDCPNQGVARQTVYCGGPVSQHRGFVLHSLDHIWQDSLRVGDGICVTSSKAVLQALAEGQGPASTMILLGYAAWSAGQLEDEIRRNFWLTCQADAHILFEVDSAHKRQAVGVKLGVDLSRLSTSVGYA